MKKVKSNDSQYNSGLKDGHYFLNNPLEKDKLEGLEAFFRIEFPQEYRNFILNIGNGGAGPAYGLFSMDDSLEVFTRLMFDKDLGIPLNEYLAKPFEVINDDWNAPGLWPICDFGCARYDFIVISGRERGNIWTFVDNAGLFPKYHPSRNADLSLKIYSEPWLEELRSEKNEYRVGFETWYGNWLNKE